MTDQPDPRLARFLAEETSLLAHRARLDEQKEQVDLRLRLVRGAIQALNTPTSEGQA